MCQKFEDSQEHLFNCNPLRLIVGEHDCLYEDIFSNNVNKLYKVATVLKRIVGAREEFDARMEQE